MKRSQLLNRQGGWFGLSRRHPEVLWYGFSIRSMPVCKKWEAICLCAWDVWCLQVSYTTHRCLSCTIPTLDWRRFGAGVAKPWSSRHLESCMGWSGDEFLLRFCCLIFDLFSLSKLDISNRQLACMCWLLGPRSQPTLSYTFPNLSRTFQFKALSLSFFHACLLKVSIAFDASHGFSHWRRQKNCVEVIFYMFEDKTFEKKNTETIKLRVEFT